MVVGVGGDGGGGVAYGLGVSFMILITALYLQECHVP